MASRFLVGLDIGTCSTKVCVVEYKGGKMVLHGLFKEPSSGLRKGAIFDLGETASTVSRALETVKKISKAAAKNVFINVNTPQTRVQNSRGIVAVSRVDNEIFQDDIDRVIKASQAVSVAPNHLIIHNLTKEFIVDGVPEIENPIGLSGSRLEVSSFVIDAFSPHVRNAMKAVEMAGGEVGGVVYNPLTAAKSALTKNQKNLGVALVDIGHSTTGFSVYEDNKLVGMKILPFGSANVTNDLAVGLKIPVAIAENLKIAHGNAYSRDVGSRESIDLKKYHSEAKGTVSRRFVCEIIESRLAEILELINNELKALDKAGTLAGGVVFVGGGSKISGLTELAKHELKLASQIGYTVGTDSFEEATIHSPESFEDPAFVNSLGLIFWGAEKQGLLAGPKPMEFNFKNIFRYFLP